MSSFDMDQTGLATIQFVDATGAPTAGPNDKTLGTPTVPGCSSDNPAVATAGETVAGATPGLFTCQYTPVAPGTFNASIDALQNSDSTPILETEGPNAGQPFGLPAPIAVTVAAGAAESMTFSIAGQ